MAVAVSLVGGTLSVPPLPTRRSRTLQEGQTIHAAVAEILENAPE